MSNNLTAASPTFWSRTAGRKLYKATVFKELASFQEQEKLKLGRIVDKPYRADLVAESYTKGTAATAQDLTYTSNTLTVDKSDDIHFYVDDIDKLQNAYDTAAINAEEAGLRLGVKMDSHFLYQVTDANDTIDASDVGGGTAGDGIDLGTTNVDDVFGAVAEVMLNNNVPYNEKAMVISPYFHRVLWNRVANKDSNFGDAVAENGRVKDYGGFKLYVSNNLTCSATWTPADNPADEATISIQGITFTFQSVIGTTAGNILQTTNTATTIDNLVALINAGGVGDGTNYVSLSAANKRAVQNWVAVDGTTYFQVFIKGASTLTLTTSEALDVWSQYVQHAVALRPKMAIDMVVQRYPSMKFQEGTAQGYAGVFGLMLSLYGAKVFSQGTKELVNVKIDETDITT